MPSPASLGSQQARLTDVTVDGHSGKYVELTVATDIATCAVDAGEAPLSGFWLWASPDGDRRYVQGSDETVLVPTPSTSMASD